MANVKPERPKIVVAMTTCNSGRFLQPQLDSIASQDRLPDAVVISDDASTDGTVDVVDTFAAMAAFPVTVMRADSRSGLHQNTAKALSAAAAIGSVVVPADHDDIWAPEKLSAAEVVFAARPDVSMWFSDADLIDENDRPLGTKLSEIVNLGRGELAELRRGGGVRRLVHGGTITGGTSALRADVIPYILPFPEDTDGRYPYFYQDAWIALVARLLGEFETDERCLLHYRRHAGQMSARGPAEISGASPRLERRRQRERNRAATGLIASRIRERPSPAWKSLRTDEVLAWDSFLAARTIPWGAAGRARALVDELRGGSYSRFARGPRTFIADMLGL